MIQEKQLTDVEEYLMEIKAKKELKSIEYMCRGIDSDSIRKIAIWEDIAMQINSCTEIEKKYWSIVMNLYNEKYNDNLKQIEILDDEIERISASYCITAFNDKIFDAFINGAKWYREQLKQRQC